MLCGVEGEVGALLWRITPAAAPAHIPISVERENRYLVGREVATGGTGRVVIAFDNDIHREVAMKICREFGDDADERTARFLQEAQITGQLEHPNIVPVHEVGYRRNGEPYFTMKLIRGRPLSEVLDAVRRTGRLPALGQDVPRERSRASRGKTGAGDAPTAPASAPLGTVSGEDALKSLLAEAAQGREKNPAGDAANSGPAPATAATSAEGPPAAEVSAEERALTRAKLLQTFVHVCQAVAFAHSRGVIHRDLKPENVMMGEYGETLVVDWGLAKVARAPEPGAASTSSAPAGGGVSTTPAAAVTGPATATATATATASRTPARSVHTLRTDRRG
ncbi:MAG: protein kinase, partial [Planctomycetes bacterium]|nr:protein kinase [Planctomycetota bacterium]